MIPFYEAKRRRTIMPEKIKKTNIEKCPYWDELIGCWNCECFDNENGKKETCPFHKDQTFLSQKKRLNTIEKIMLNSEFGKLAKNLKGENKNG